MRHILLISILCLGCGREELAARNGRIAELEGQVAGLTMKAEQAEKRLAEVQRVVPETQDSPQLSVGVRDELRYIEAIKLVHLHDHEIRKLPANQSMMSEKLGCMGLISCPSDYDVLSLANRAFVPLAADVVEHVHDMAGLPVLLKGKLTGIDVITAPRGPALTIAGLATPQGAFIAYGHYPTDFAAGQDVELVGVLGYLQKVQEAEIPTVAMMALLTPGSVAKIRAAYPAAQASTADVPSWLQRPVKRRQPRPSADDADIPTKSLF